MLLWDNCGNEKTLYHATDKIIEGKLDITRCNRNTDFGQGFYLSENTTQPLKYISFFDKGFLYKFSIDNELYLKNLYIIEDKIEWLMYIAYNRGKIRNKARKNIIYNKFIKYIENNKIIKGAIADDKMFTTMDNFFKNYYTLEDTVRILKMIELGNQVVIKDNSLLENLTLEEVIEVDEKELMVYRQESKNEKSGIESLIQDNLTGKGIYYRDIVGDPNVIN